MQEPIEFIAFWQRATTALYIENNIPRKERLIPPHLKKSREFYGLSPWKRKIIPQRVTSVGCNGPTKRNVTLEGMVKDITQGL